MFCFQRGAVVEWLERLGYVAESRRKAGLRHATTRNSFYPSTKGVPFFEIGKDKAAEGERWALSFISCA